METVVDEYAEVIMGLPTKADGAYYSGMPVTVHVHVETVTAEYR